MIIIKKWSKLNKEYWSEHAEDKLVDELLSVAPVASSLERVSFLWESSSWGSELEWPQEVVGFLEVGTNSGDLVDQILHWDDSVLAQNLFDDCVVGDGDSLLVYLTETSFQN